MCDLSENIVAGHVDILHVDTRKGKKAWKRPLKREDAFHVTKGYIKCLLYIYCLIDFTLYPAAHSLVYKIHFIGDSYSFL